MDEIEWFSRTRPAGVVGVATDGGATGDPAAEVVVVTAAGHPSLRVRDGSGWRWEQLGPPPGNAAARSAGCVVLDAEPGVVVAPVVVGGSDGRVWLRRRGAAGDAWVDLGGPGQPSALLAAVTVRQDTGLRHLLVLGSGGRQLWLRQDLGPDGTWFALTPDTDQEVEELAVAGGAPAGDRVQEHLFAVVRDPATLVRTLRVAVRENAVWTWVDPGQRPDGADPAGLFATSFTDATGTVRAAAAVRGAPQVPGGAGTVAMLVGAGRSWEWVELDGPPGTSALAAAVLARTGPDPAAADDPVVVARAGDHLWRRTRGTDWVDLGPFPGAVVDPVAAHDGGPGAAGRRLRVLGVGRDEHLWTLDVQGTTVRWEDHGLPGSLAAVVDGYTAFPTDFLFRSYVLDGEGRLWGSTQVAQSDSAPSAPVWDDLGRPDPTVAARGVGVFAVHREDIVSRWVHVLGADGRLWARTELADVAWVDHGVPPGLAIRAVLPPPPGADPDDGPAVPVLAEDGQLWVSAATGPDRGWTSRGAPPGRLVFALVGAVTLFDAPGRRPVVAVIGDDGHVWLDAPSGATFDWLDLGVPAAGGRAVAGVGAALLFPDRAPATLHAVVVASPGGHVRSCRWTAGAAPEWTDLDRPGGHRVTAAVGVLRHPADPARLLTWVVADDGGVWLHDGTTPGSWTPWGRPPDTAELAGGRAVALDGARPGVVLLGTDGRLWIGVAGAN